MSLPRLSQEYIKTISGRRLEAAVGSVESAFSGSIQTQDWGGRWWVFDIQTPLLIGARARALNAFLNGLGGMSGRFIFHDPTQRNIEGLGNPIVDGAAQTGSKLKISGLTLSKDIFQPGDLFNLGDEATTRLYEITKAARSDASGKAEIDIQPNLRYSPIDGQTIDFREPKALVRLVKWEGMSIAPGDKFSTSFSLREAI